MIFEYLHSFYIIIADTSPYLRLTNIIAFCAVTSINLEHCLRRDGRQGS